MVQPASVAGGAADYAPVRGCMIVRPYGWALWENIYGAARPALQGNRPCERGVSAADSQSFISKEQSHVAGFSPELAVVTHGGGEKLEEPLVIRPTSETIIGHAYAKWIQSYRDLPVLINQWNSVVRWNCARSFSFAHSNFTGRKATRRTRPMRKRKPKRA